MLSSGTDGHVFSVVNQVVIQSQRGSTGFVSSDISVSSSSAERSEEIERGCKVGEVASARGVAACEREIS